MQVMTQKWNQSIRVKYCSIIIIISVPQGLAALPAVSEWLKYCETYWQGKLIFALHSLLHGIKYRKNYNISLDSNNFNYYFKYHDTISYCDICDSDMQYYHLVVSHIPSCSHMPLPKGF